jgi:hypothetical protein
MAAAENGMAGDCRRKRF